MSLKTDIIFIDVYILPVCQSTVSTVCPHVIEVSSKLNAAVTHSDTAAASHHSGSEVEGYALSLEPVEGGVVGFDGTRADGHKLEKKCTSCCYIYVCIYTVFVFIFTSGVGWTELGRCAAKGGGRTSQAPLHEPHKLISSIETQSI